MAWRWASLGGWIASAATSSLIAVACAQGQGAIDFGPGGDADPDASSGPDGARLPPSDSGGGGSDGGGKTDDDSGAGPGCTGKVVINELQCEGPDGAEFIELYNPNSCAVSLTGWKIPYRASGGNQGLGMHTFGAGDSIPAQGFLLLANDKFSGSADATFNGGGGLGNNGGQIGLVDDADTLIDAVGFGPSTSGMYTEQAPTPLPNGSGSVGRKSDGVDTDDNSADFKSYTQHSAGVSNP